MAFKINNTFYEWCKLKKDIEQKASSHELLGALDIMKISDDAVEEKELRVFKVNVEISCLPNEEKNDVTLLLYAFPIFDIVRESVKAHGVLNICVDGQYFKYNNFKVKAQDEDEKIKEGFFHSTKAQLIHYLYMQLYFRQSLRITINDEPLNPISTRFGKINPLMSFTNQPNTNFFYKDVYNVIEEPQILCALKKFLLKYREDPRYDAIINSNEYVEILKFTKYVNPNFEQESRARYPKSTKLSLETMWNLPFSTTPTISYEHKNIGVDDVYFKLFLSNISYIVSREIKGTHDNPIKEINKINLIDSLLDYVEKSCWNVPVLAQYLWSILVRYTFTNGKIIGGIAQKRYLIQEFMERTLQNAISYAESLYQIIENSCFHTSTGNAYFSVRIYETDTSASFADSIKANQLLLNFSQEFIDYDFVNQKAKLYLNFILVDNSYDSIQSKTIGMVDSYNNDREVTSQVSSIKELFNLVPKTESELSVHYGLRVLKKIISVNNGCFVVTTANKNYAYRVANNKEREDLEENSKVYNGTRYSILLPLNKRIVTQAENVDSDVSELFDVSNILNENIEPLKIQLSIETAIPKSQKEKNKYVNELYEQIVTSIEKNKKENKIICLYLEDSKHYKIELLAKAIMKYTINTKTECNRLAILFDEKKYIYEFIRIYSVFFDKSGENYEMFKLHDTQIALCSMREEIPEVNMILSGNNLSVVRHTSKMYAYYNADSSLEFIPTISYITKTENSQTYKATPIFPFDIYLDINSFNQPYKMDARGIIEDNTWFFKRITQVLNTDMRTCNYGCKIDDIHISIGSKIHINSFYNAELLFHNYGNICRFAYIVAREILREHRTERKKIRLISYESYSALFAQKICDIIRQYDKNYDIDFIIYSANSERMQPEQNEYFWKDIEKYANGNCEETIWHVILPIGTTLSTICKIQDIARIIGKHINPTFKLDFGKSIALILVGGVENNIGVDMGYWESLDVEHKKIYLQQYQPLTDEKNYGILSKNVRYYFNVGCNWWDAKENVKTLDNINYEIGKNSKQLCLIGVDKTSTIPDVIFEQFNSQKKLFAESNQLRDYSAVQRKKEKIDNWDKIDLIKQFDCVRYSHLYNAGNHFQYDFDYYKLCKETETQEEIIKWLNTLRTKIDTDAFNIIVSPLDIKNSIFLKLVTAVGFESCSRLLHVNINESYRENVRNKFSYIRKEFEQLNKISQNIKVNVYYVDDCIVSGHTLHRGNGFIRMLLEEKFLNTHNVCIYKGVIVLANRSSYDTIQEFLPERVEDDFHYFMRLNVPLYNTYNGQCPACDLAQQYELMHKRSSTHIIASEYNRLMEKHSLKTFDEYDTYIEKEIWNKNSYLIWFKKWMFFSTTETDKYIDDALVTVYKHICNSKDEYDNLNEVFLTMELALNKRNFVDAYKKHIIADRAYKRMYCTHEILTAIDAVMQGVNNENDAEIETRKLILTVMQNHFDAINNKDNSVFYKMWEKAEWLISYIKVISRSQIAKYYHVRNTVYNLLSELTQALIGTKNNSEDIQFLINICDVKPENRFENSITPDVKFNIFLTIIRRLADLYSPLIILEREKLYEFYKKCKQQYNAQGEFSSFYLSNGDNPEKYKDIIPFMSDSNFDFQIAKLTKWSAMSGYDGSYCFEIEKSFLKDENLNNNSKFCKKLAYLENTYIIYMGIKNIVETVAGYDRKFDFKFEDILKIRNIIQEKNTDSKIYLHKIFFDFVSLFESKKQNSSVVYNEKYKDMCLLFSTLRHIEANANIIDSPYPYEKLCNYIRSITGYEQCVIAYKEDRYAKVLVASDIDSKYLFDDLSNEMLSEVIRKFDKQSKIEKADDIVQKFCLKRNPDAEIVVIKIPISKNDKTSAYIVVYRGETFNSEPTHENLSIDDCWNVRNVLFLRDKIETVLSRDMTSLISMLSSYDYVEALNESGPTILHISDLHISTKNADKMIEAIEKNDTYVTEPRDALKNIKPDLILITGDIVQASYSATSLVKNYIEAERVIKNLVNTVWSFSGEQVGRDENLKQVKYVRNDWKKRVLISTGNHDYASMNELEAQNKARTTTAGIPSENLGSTLIKYSYFIDFLHRLLGMDIDRATKYDLNDIIQYRKLNLSVYNINSGSGVNPYRTNKVKVNSRALQKLMSTENEQYCSIHMMHHTPIYNINYISDIYYVSNSILNEAYNLIYSSLGLSPKINISNIWIPLIENLINVSKEPIQGMSVETQEILLRGMIDKIKEMNTHVYIEKNLSDLKYYLKTTPVERKNDDRCSQVLSALRERKEMGERDNNAFANSVKEYCEQITEDFYILGGHEHRERKYDGERSGVLHKCKGIFEAGKFFNPEDITKLHYSFLQCGKNYKFVNGPSAFLEEKYPIIDLILTESKEKTE